MCPEVQAVGLVAHGPGGVGVVSLLRSTGIDNLLLHSRLALYFNLTNAGPPDGSTIGVVQTVVLIVTALYTKGRQRGSIAHEAIGIGTRQDGRAVIVVVMNASGIVITLVG